MTLKKVELSATVMATCRYIAPPRPPDTSSARAKK